MEKLQGLGKVTHNLQGLTCDYQPTVGEGIMCFVTGDLIIGDDLDKPLKFTQAFNLVKGGPAGIYIHNDIFRLNIS